MPFRRRQATPAAGPPQEESWAESALWGASVVILLVFLLFASIGYMGYSSLERPRREAAVGPAAPPAPVVKPPAPKPAAGKRAEPASTRREARAR